MILMSQESWHRFYLSERDCIICAYKDVKITYISKLPDPVVNIIFATTLQKWIDYSYLFYLQI